MQDASFPKLGARRAHGDGNVCRTAWHMHGIHPIGQGSEFTSAGSHGHVTILIGTAEGDHRNFHVILLTMAELCRITEPKGQRTSFHSIEPVGGNGSKVVPNPWQDLREVTSQVARVGVRVQVSIGEKDTVGICRIIARQTSGANGAQRRGINTPGLEGIRLNAQGIRQAELNGGHVPRAESFPLGTAMGVIDIEPKVIVGRVQQLGGKHVHDRSVGRIGVATHVLAFGKDDLLEVHHARVIRVQALDDGATHARMGGFREDGPVGEVGRTTTALVEIVEEIPPLRRGSEGGIGGGLGAGHHGGGGVEILEAAGDYGATGFHGAYVVGEEGHGEHAHESEDGDGIARLLATAEELHSAVERAVDQPLTEGVDVPRAGVAHATRGGDALVPRLSGFRCRHVALVAVA
mmetsp:Transcript_15662/g.33066  ORF Transcript_15662/g.33066 Transcript_15662/m.33066 type:complete len:406 (-) Transcript_15662:354-1571(-)